MPSTTVVPLSIQAHFLSSYCDGLGSGIVKSKLQLWWLQSFFVNKDSAIVVKDLLGATGGMNIMGVYVLEFADLIMNGVTFPKLVLAMICTQQLSVTIIVSC